MRKPLRRVKPLLRQARRSAAIARRDRGAARASSWSARSAGRPRVCCGVGKRLRRKSRLCGSAGRRAAAELHRGGLLDEHLVGPVVVQVYRRSTAGCRLRRSAGLARRRLLPRFAPPRGARERPSSRCRSGASRGPVAASSSEDRRDGGRRHGSDGPARHTGLSSSSSSSSTHGCGNERSAVATSTEVVAKAAHP